jgi:hypothetical protein
MTPEDLDKLWETATPVEQPDEDLDALWETARPERSNRLEEASDQAVKGVSEDMGVLEKGIVGVGRGLTDVGQAGRQLFEKYVDDPIANITGQGFTDKSADEYREDVARERDTYETGLGEDTAANIGRVVGQSAPSLVIPGGAAVGTAGKIAGRTAQGALGGGIASGASAAGLEEEEILGAAGEGATVGGAISGAFPVLGATLRSKPVSGLFDNIAEYGVRMRSGDEVAKAAARMPADRLRGLGLNDETIAFAKRFGKESIDDLREELGGDAVEEMVAELTTAFAGDMSLKGALGTAGRELKSSVNTITQGNLGTLADDLTGRDLLYTGGGFAVGGPVGAGLGLTASRVTPTIKGYVGASLETGSDLIQRKLTSDPQSLGKFAEPLAQAARRGGPSLAATMHVMSQTDPAFRAKMDMLERQEKEDVQSNEDELFRVED